MIQNLAKIIILLFPLLAFSASKTAIIGKEKVSLRGKPSFLQKKVGAMKYGDRVKLLKKKRSWSLVSKGKLKGWVHSSSLKSNRKILKEIGKGNKIASKINAKDISLAGKGFSPEHEQKLKNKNVSFKDVDSIEKYGISFRRLNKFAKKGKLRTLK